MKSYSRILHLYLCSHGNRFLSWIPLFLVVFGKSISACGIVTSHTFLGVAACLAFGFLLHLVSFNLPPACRRSLQELPEMLRLEAVWKQACNPVSNANFPILIEKMLPQVLWEVAVTACPPLGVRSFWSTRRISMFECIECCVVFTCFCLDQSVDSYLFSCYHLSVSVLVAW